MSKPSLKVICQLAIEMEYFSHRQMEAAVRRWQKMPDPRPEICDFLVENKLLSRTEGAELRRRAEEAQAAPDDDALTGWPSRLHTPQPGDPVVDLGDILQPGQRLDHYQVLAVAGSGGMGTVYRARHVETGDDVALKVLSADGFETTEAKSRFLREARIAAQLDHPHIVRFRELAKLESGGYYYAMDLVEGCDYHTFLAKQLPPFCKVARTLAVVAEAIQHVHERGIVHRDLKPENILIREDGTPLVADFGLAKWVHGTKPSTQITHAGAVLGTYGYWPPEQRRGDMKCVDERSDVYALGGVLYKALTGRDPPLWSNEATFSRRRSPAGTLPQADEPPVPEPLQAICLHCLEKSPEERYQTAQELADDLRRFLDGEPVTARMPAQKVPVSPAAMRSSGRKKKAILIAIAIIALGLAVLAAKAGFY